MSQSSADSVPQGWYPDPGGERQWRVWTGEHWSELTRPYGEPASPPTVASSLPLLGALRRLVHYGVVAVFAGVGLVVSVLAHWPGTAHPTSRLLATALFGAGVGLLAIGSVAFAFAVRELEGHWTLEALAPGVNVVMFWSLVTRRVTGQRYWLRDAFAVLVMVLFVTQAHSDPALGVLPSVIAWDLVVMTQALLAQLSESAVSPSPES